MKLKELEYERYILSTKPVLWLPLYRKGGDVIVSSDGYGHIGTVTGATWGLQGRTFAAGTQNISLGNPAALQLQTNFTLWAWVNPTNFDASRGIISRDDDEGGNRNWMLYITLTTGLLSFYGFVGGALKSVTGSTGLTAGVWSFVCATWTNTAINVYLNGVADAVAVNPGGQADNDTVNTIIGNRGDNDADMVGTIGDIGAHNRVLTTGEMLQIMSATQWRYK